MRRVLMSGMVISLLSVGCADKKLNTTSPTGANGAMGATNPIVYDNVDPVGEGMSQGNGAYGSNATNSGTYGDNTSQYGASSGVQNIYFNVNQYHITADKLGIISHNANLLRNSAKIKVEGHCDASGSDEYNYALGLKRAKATKDALISNGIPATKIMLVSMGESSPECTSSTSSGCYAKNRRVEFKVMQ